MRKSKILFIAGLLTIVVFMSSTARAITVTGPFGPLGSGGTVNGQSITIGATGSVFQLESFLNITGVDLNGGFFGTSGQLDIDPLPAGLDATFTSSLSAIPTDLTLSYMFTNNTGGTLSGVQFISALNADIGGSFSDDFGLRLGAPGTGSNDANADSFEIDDPVTGDINSNIFLGTLDNTPSLLFGPGDVAFALGFDLGDLNPLDIATIDILISEVGNSIGSPSLLLFDGDFETFVTMSGQADIEPIPEPATIALMGIGLVGLAGATVRKRLRLKGGEKN